jgi:hypothetical protein
MLSIVEHPPADALLRVAPSTRAVVSWNADAPSGGIALVVHRTDGTVSESLLYARWSEIERRSLDGTDAKTRIAIDVVRSDVPFAAIGIESTVALDAVAVATPPQSGTHARPIAQTAALDVPEISQYVRRAPLERGWCSAAALTMLLRFHGIDADVENVAGGVRDIAYGGTGNWSFNAAYAGARGLRAVVAYLCDLDHVAAFVDAGLPVAISIAWQPGELPGAPLQASDGHLLVVRGLEPTAVLVNDPAQPSIAVRYPRSALERVFRAHGGVAYLVAPRTQTAQLVALANAPGLAARP